MHKIYLLDHVIYFHEYFVVRNTHSLQFDDPRIYHSWTRLEKNKLDTCPKPVTLQTMTKMLPWSASLCSPSCYCIYDS